MRIYQPDRELLKQFVEESCPLLTGHVLDIGGEDGRRYHALLAGASKYTNLDIDASKKPDIIASVERMPLPDASIDNALCMEVLMYVADLPAAMAEISRVLKPRGYFVATTSLMPTPSTDRELWFFTKHGLMELLEQDFEEIRIERRGGYFTLTAQNWIRYRIEKHHLYENRWLGRCFHYISAFFGRIAMGKDARDTSDGQKSFTMGYNIVARRKQSV